MNVCWFPFLDCGCSATGSVDRKCQRNGKCECKPNFRGDKCDECQKGFYGYPECKGMDFPFSLIFPNYKHKRFLECDCDSQGTIQDICVRHNGQCLCRDGFDGKKCEKCGEGFFAFPKCLGRFQMLLYSFLHAIKYW